MMAMALITGVLIGGIAVQRPLTPADPVPPVRFEIKLPDDVRISLIVIARFGNMIVHQQDDEARSLFKINTCSVVLNILLY